MGFWGIEVKPGKPHPYHSDNVQGKLHVTQATLGLGSSSERSILQCSVGEKNSIFLCSLKPNKTESCSLNLEFDEDDLVAFSVIGARSIHLSGYFVADGGHYLQDEYDSDYFEDIAETETDESSKFDTEDEYGDDFIEDDGNDEVFPVPNSGVVIEEIVDDDDPTDGNGSKRLKKKDWSSESEQQTVVKNGASVPVLESEDEDGFPISALHKGKGTSREAQVEADKERDKRTSEGIGKKKAKDSSDYDTSKKRKVKISDQDDQPERKNKKKKKKQKEKGEEGKVDKGNTCNETNDLPDGENKHESKCQNLNQMDLDNNVDTAPSENRSQKEKKKQKKKKKAQEIEGNKRTNQTVSAMEDKKEPTLTSEEMQTAAKSSQVRTFPNGLVIEEVAMGKPDGKRASPGKKVSVHYIGKLKKNGKIFDSNVGRAPFKFRLGVGQVIKGWDVGVNGMRVGDKRRLVIPPSMGYGAEGAGGQIPPNSWLVFDVELIDVR